MFRKSFGIGLVGGLLAQPLEVRVDLQSVKALDAISLPLITQFLSKISRILKNE
jgi:hypothetical protein